MNTFKDIPLNVRVAVLKSLPKGESLIYHNSKSVFDQEVVIKIADHNWLMMVLLDGTITPIHYKNLEHEKFSAAVAVAKAINQ